MAKINPKAAVMVVRVGGTDPDVIAHLALASPRGDTVTIGASTRDQIENVLQNLLNLITQDARDDLNGTY